MPAAPSFDRRAATATCRGCGHAGLAPVIDFGLMPASDGFVAVGHAGVQAPLALAFCPACALAQLLDTRPPAELFGADYIYLSSMSGSVATEAAANAAQLVERYRLTQQSFAVEIACNDGYLLRHLDARGIRCLGVEPAPVPAAAARANGIAVIESFFSPDLAREIAHDHGGADIAIANNVLAHVPDPNALASAMALLLAAGGQAVLEVHSLAALVENLQFDTIYHEHASYFSATSAAHLFRRHGLTLLDVEPIALQGGSLRLHLGRDGTPSDAVARQLDLEATAGVADGTALTLFAERVQEVIATLRQMLLSLAAEGKAIAAYGAAAKGTMLLNHIGLDRGVIARVADRNPHKQGRNVPGVGIPIVAPEALFADPPDVVLLLPWNLRDEILDVLAPLRARGTRVIVPLPRPEIL